MQQSLALPKMCHNCSSPTLLLKMQNGTAILENILAILTQLYNPANPFIGICSPEESLDHQPQQEQDRKREVLSCWGVLAPTPSSNTLRISRPPHSFHPRPPEEGEGLRETYLVMYNQ